MQYAYHLPSNLSLRSHKEVINYILYEVISEKQDEEKSKTSKKRKLALVAIDNNVRYVLYSKKEDLYVSYIIITLKQD